MAEDEIEWLDEPAPPTAAPEGTPGRRPRRPALLVVGALAAVAVVGSALVVGRGGDRESAPTPSAVTTPVASPVVSSVVSPVPSFSIRIPDPSPGLLRAVADNFHGAVLRTIGACDTDGGSYGFELRSLTIHVDVGCARARQRIDSRDPNQIVVSGHDVRVLINSPRNTINARDYAAARRLAADRRVASS